MTRLFTIIERYDPIVVETLRNKNINPQVNLQSYPGYEYVRFFHNLVIIYYILYIVYYYLFIIYCLLLFVYYIYFFIANYFLFISSCLLFIAN